MFVKRKLRGRVSRQPAKIGITVGLLVDVGALLGVVFRLKVNGDRRGVGVGGRVRAKHGYLDALEFR